MPGRLGLLVTLHLIAANIYISVEGPRQRGFSYIEIWMVGMQVPILMAVIEYGIILAMKKQDTKRLNLRKISITSQIAMYDFEKIVDKWICYGSFAYIIIFNCAYWTAAEISKTTK